MGGIIFIFVILTFSILITRIATVALTHTGLSRESARFQARSAFTGVGFTTTEAEQVVRHPVRRRIVMLLMLLGNVGIVSALASLILTFVNSNNAEALGAPWRLLILLLGLGCLWLLASSQIIDRWMNRIIDRALRKYTGLYTEDYAKLLKLTGEYTISELEVEPNDWMAGQTLLDLRLRDEGVLVLAINRATGHFLGAPSAETPIQPGDTLILYAREAAIRRLDRRTRDARGEREHSEAVREQATVEKIEQYEDKHRRSERETEPC